MVNLHVAARQRRIHESLRNIELAPRPTLPATGLLCWADVSPFVPFARRTLGRMIKQGRFPQGQRLGNRLVWRAETIHAWISETLPTQYAEQ